MRSGTPVVLPGFTEFRRRYGAALPMQPSTNS
ncbi:hypothetical protein FB565_006779 [Actinoplanes lutulentus]|nr:hypothetical protein [Actinoplanes lutulentus]